VDNLGGLFVNDKLNEMWKDVLSMAREKLPQGATEIWLKTCLPISLEGGILTLDVPNVFVKEQIQSRFLGGLRELVTGRGLAREVELVVGTEMRDGEQKRAETAARQAPPPPDGLNPNYYSSPQIINTSLVSHNTHGKTNSNTCKSVNERNWIHG